MPLNAKERFTALQSGEIDLLSRNTTWTMSRDTSLGLNFTGVMYYDGQAFMVHKSLGLKSVRELAGASICVQTGTTNEQNLADYFATTGLTYRPVVFERLVEVIAAYTSGRCDAFTTDSSQVISERTRLPDPDDACDPARAHLEGAPRTGRAPGRCGLGQHRALDPLRHAERGGAGR